MPYSSVFNAFHNKNPLQLHFIPIAMSSINDDDQITGYEPIHRFQQNVPPPSKARSKRNRKAIRQTSSETNTPPTYTVEEDTDGRLVNRRLRVVWPQRSKLQSHIRGSHGLPLESDIQRQTTTNSSERRHRKKVDQAPDTLDSSLLNTSSIFQNTSSMSSNNPYSDAESQRKSSRESDSKQRDFNTLFKGCLTTKGAESAVKTPNEFVLYYQLPSTLKSTIPSSIPLTLAYKSTAGRVYHFPIGTCVGAENNKTWYVKYGDPAPQQFSSLEALIRFYSIFSYVEPVTGRVDTFPVWKGVVIDYAARV